MSTDSLAVLYHLDDANIPRENTICDRYLGLIRLIELKSCEEMEGLKVRAKEMRYSIRYRTLNAE